jgi:hypothetical protein
MTYYFWVFLPHHPLFHQAVHIALQKIYAWHENRNLRYSSVPFLFSGKIKIHQQEIHSAHEQLL